MTASLSVIRVDECRTMAWKNGGGETTEIALFPPDAALDDFGWRVSIARVAGDGPFSVFPGVDRTLAVLDGAGLRLTVGDAAPVDLQVDDAPLPFAADVLTDATLIDGVIVDFNVMTRRGAYWHEVTAVHALTGVQSVAVATRAATVLWLCQRGGVRLDAGADEGAGPVRLGAGQCLLAQGLPPTFWQLTSDAEARLMRVEIDTVA